MGGFVTVTDLLREARRLGIELVADGERLRYRPRDRMTPELAQRLRERKGELLAVLCVTDTETPCGSSESGIVSPPRRDTGGNGWPPIPDGWMRSHWIDRLRQLAGRCEPYVPDRATWLRSWADFLDQGT